MKNFYILLFMMLSYTSYSQKTAGNYEFNYIEGEGKGKDTFKIFEQWIKTPYGVFVMNFEQTPIGLKHLRELVDSILFSNNMTNLDYDYNNSYLPKEYENEQDYSILNSLMLSGKGEIRVSYKIGKIDFNVTLKQKNYIISFHNIK